MFDMMSFLLVAKTHKECEHQKVHQNKPFKLFLMHLIGIFFLFIYLNLKITGLRKQNGQLIIFDSFTLLLELLILRQKNQLSRSLVARGMRG
jgi:hypothetical protein